MSVTSYSNQLSFQPNQPFDLWNDNCSAIALTCNAQFHGCSKPILLNDLLSILIPHINHTCIVHMFSSKENDNLPLIKPYFVSIQNMSCLLSYSQLWLNLKLIDRLISKPSMKPTTMC